METGWKAFAIILGRGAEAGNREDNTGETGILCQALVRSLRLTKSLPDKMLRTCNLAPHNCPSCRRNNSKTTQI